MTLCYTLDNGLTVLLEPTHAAPVVAMQAWVGVGSADETEQEAGLAHFHEHMLFKGTERRGVGEIAQEVEGVGGQINAWTSFNETTYHLVLPAASTSKGLDILADVLSHSIFDPDELEKESEVILEEIKQGQDSPAQKIGQALFANVFTQHPYRLPIIGNEKTVRGFTRKDLVRFYKKWYAPNNMTLVVAGDFEVPTIKRRIRKLFGGMEHRTIRRKKHKEPKQTQLRLKTLREDVQESYLQLGFNIPSALHEDSYALELLAVILGQGGSSRLYQELERNRQCVNGIASYAYTMKDHGLFLITSPLPPGQEKAAIDGILEEVVKIQNALPARDEVEKARTAVESDAIYMRQSVQGVARALGYYHSVAGDYRFEETFYRNIAQVKREDVQRVARKYLQLDNLTLCVMTPKNTDEKPFRLNRRSIESTFNRFQKAVEAPAISKASSEVKRYTLSNGVRLLLKEVRHAPMVSMRAAMLGGLRAETAKNNGIGQLTVQLLSQGTPRRDAIEIAQTVDSMAASLGGFSGRNSLGMQMECLSRTFDPSLELFAECLLEPTFPEEELERVRRLFLEEIRSQEDQVASKTFQLFTKTLFPKHPYGLPSMGSADTVSGLTRLQIQRYYKRLLNPENLVLSIVGDMDAERTAQRMESLFSTLHSSPFKAPQPKIDPAPTSIRKATWTKDKMQAHLFLGFYGTTLYDPDHYAFQVLNAVLAGQGGRLFMELRDKMSLAYSVSSSSLELLDPGCFAVYMATSPNKVDTAIEGILRELDKMRKRPITKAEHKRVLQYLAGSHAISLQYNGAQAMSYALNELYDLGFDYSEHYQEALRQVTPQQVQEVAQKYFQLDRYVLAMTQPE